MTARTLPPGPSMWASIRNIADPFGWMQQLVHQHSDPMTVPIPGQSPMVITWSPENLRRVFAADPDTFAPGAADALALIAGQGSLFMQKGERHRRTRKLLAPPFHGDRMRSYAEAIHATAVRWAAAHPRDVSAPILPTAQGITLDVILAAIFGAEGSEQTERLHADILGIVEAFHPLIAMFRFMQQDFGGLGPWARFRTRTEALHGRMRTLVAAKRATPGQDILSLLVAARHDDGSPLEEQEILEQLLTFVIAGHETTATTLAWALYELHRAPEVLGRLREALAELGEAPTPESHAKVPYLSAVISETLRLHPPLPIVPRKCERDFELAGYTLPAGTTLGVGLYLAHLRPEVFGEPLVFRPERHLERTFTPFELLPFGGGARRCLGAAFATFELHIVLPVLLAAGSYRLDEPRPLRTVSRVGTFGPEHGVRMTLTSRP